MPQHVFGELFRVVQPDPISGRSLSKSTPGFCNHSRHSTATYMVQIIAKSRLRSLA